MLQNLILRSNGYIYNQNPTIPKLRIVGFCFLYRNHKILENLIRMFTFVAG